MTDVSREEEVNGQEIYGEAEHRWSKEDHGAQVHSQEVHGTQVDGEEVHRQEVHGEEVHRQEVHGQEEHGAQVHGSQVDREEADGCSQVDGPEVSGTQVDREAAVVREEAVAVGSPDVWKGSANGAPLPRSPGTPVLASIPRASAFPWPQPR